MPTSDLDVPLLPSAEQIRNRTFATVRRGYDPDQVQDYLVAIATQVETLEKDLKQARLNLETASAQAPPAPMPAAPTEDPYDRISKRFSGLIATADREASRIVEEAMTEADRIRVDAQANAERDKQEGAETLETAREEADRILAGLAARRDLLVGQLQEMQARLLSVAKDLEVSIEAPAARMIDDAIDSSAVDPGSNTEEALDRPAPMSSSEPDGERIEPREDDLWVSARPRLPAVDSDVGLEDLFADPEDAVPTQGRDPAADADQDDDSVDIPDLASIELDFDEDRPGSTD